MHTVFSDGKGTIKDNAEAAIKRGLKEIAITDHGMRNVIKHNSPEKIAAARKEIDALNAEYKSKGIDFKILLGIEANSVGLDGRMDIEDFSAFDFIMAGFHRSARMYKLKDYFLYSLPAYRAMFFKPTKKSIERNTEAIIKLIQRYPVSFISHISNYAVVDVEKVCKVCAEKGVFIEINCRHVFRKRFMMKDFFDKVYASGVKLICNTDAHTPDTVGDFKNVEEFLSGLGYDVSDRIVNLNSAPVFKNPNE